MADSYLDHLQRHEVRSSDDVLQLLTAVWQVFEFPELKDARKPKSVLHGRARHLKSQPNVDCMVRQDQDTYVLVARYETGPLHDPS
jgi:hypothetical protein